MDDESNYLGKDTYKDNTSKKTFFLKISFFFACL